MQFWKGMTDEERGIIKSRLKKRNLDLDIPDLILPDMSAYTYKVKATKGVMATACPASLQLPASLFNKMTTSTLRQFIFQVELSEETKKFLSTA